MFLNFKQKRQWKLLAIFIAVLAIIWVSIPLELKYQIGKSLGIRSSAFGTASSFMDLRGQPKELQKFFAEAASEQPIKEYNTMVRGSNFFGTLKQTKLDASEDSGVILFVDGKKEVDIKSPQEAVAAAEGNYPELARYLHAELGVKNEIVIITNRAATPEALSAALKSGQVEAIKWAAQKITELSVRDAYPYAKLLLETCVDKHQGYEVYTGNAIKHIGELAFPYYKTVLGIANKCQSVLIGTTIAETGSKNIGIIKEIIEKYPNNDDFKLGVSMMLMFSSKFTKEENLEILLKLAEANSSDLLLNVMGALGNVGIANDQVVDALIKGLSDKSLSVQGNATISIVSLSKKFNAEQKHRIEDVLNKNILEKGDTLDSANKPIKERYQSALNALGSWW